MANRAVFAGGVHALQDDQQGFGLGGVEDVLQGVELAAVLGQNRFSAFAAVVTASGVGLEPAEPDVAARLDQVWRFDLHARAPGL